MSHNITESAQKELAAKAALNYVENNTIVGLGSGSTAEKFIGLLGEAVTQAKLRNLKVVSSSQKSASLAAALNLEVWLPENVDSIDINIDGTDETQISTGYTIKGGGNALHREKMIALKSRKNIFIAEEKKAVPQLGAFGLPIEISVFDAPTTLKRIAAVLPEKATVNFKTNAGKKIITDNGNLMAQVDFNGQSLSHPQKLYTDLMLLEGVFSVGLFLNIADQFIIGKADGTTEVFKFSTLK